MPLHLYYRPSFKRSLKRLGYEQKKIVGLILESLAAYYSSGCNLQEAQKIAPRFFHKQLRKPYYEAGIEGNIRCVIIPQQTLHRTQKRYKESAFFSPPK